MDKKLMVDTLKNILNRDADCRCGNIHITYNERIVLHNAIQLIATSVEKKEK